MPFPYTYHLQLTEYLVKYRYLVGTQQCCVLIFIAHNEREIPDTAVPLPYSKDTTMLCPYFYGR